MALFQVRSRFASVMRHHYRSSFSLTTPEWKIPTSRVTSVMSHHYQYRSSSASGFLSTMMKTPTTEDASNYLNRTVEERNEKHRKVQQLAKDANLLILSCQSTAEGGVCDVYVVGFSSFHSPVSLKAAEAIMSHLKPQVLFLPFGYKPLLSKLRKYSPTNLIKAFVNKPSDNFRSWSIYGFLSKLMPTVERVAYCEAAKYGSNVVLGDRPEEKTGITITTEDGVSDNPAFNLWIHQDKYLYIALLGACDAEARVVMSTASIARDAWLILERAFATHSRSRVMSLKERRIPSPKDLLLWLPICRIFAPFQMNYPW